MTSVPDRAAEKLSALCATAAGIVLLAIAAVVLVGWWFDVPRLKSVYPDLATMKADTAVCFALLGAGVLLAGRAAAGAAWRDRLASAVVAMAGAVGLATLFEYATGRDLGIDQLLVADRATVAGSGAPGRMAIATAFDFLCFAIAFALRNTGAHSRFRLSSWLLLPVVASATLALIGYLYGLEALYRVPAFGSVAVHTAALFEFACVGAIAVQPGSTIVRRIVSRGADGLVIRWLLPAAVLVPPAIGWLLVRGESASLYGGVFGLAAFTVSQVAVFCALVWWSAHALERLREREQALNVRNAWQEAILDSADFTVISTDPDGTIRTFNTGASRKLGYDPAELVGKRTPESMHVRDEIVARAQALTRELGAPVAPGFEAFVARARLGGSDENDWTYVRKDGSTFPVRLSVTALHDASGNITGFLGIGKDITALREAERGLRAAQAELGAIFDFSPDLLCVIDGEGMLRRCNPTWERDLGYARHEVIGRPVLDFVHPDDLDAAREALGRVLRERRTVAGVEIRWRHRDGSCRIVDWFGTPSDSEPSAFGYGRDVTEQRRMVCALAESEQLYRALFDQSLGLICEHDVDGRLEAINPAAAHALGYEPGELIGKRLHDLVAPSFRERVPVYLEAVARDGAYAGLMTVKTRDGNLREWNFSNRLHVARDGHARIIGHAQDVTEAIRHQQELQDQSLTDPLTGARNRRYLDHLLRSGSLRDWGCVVVDLDRFKAINDTYGHERGDAVLVGVVAFLTDRSRRGDVVVRMGGDEFLVLTCNDAAASAEELAARLEASAPAGSPCGLSLGWAVRESGEPMERTIARADRRLYAARQLRRGGTDAVPPAQAR